MFDTQRFAGALGYLGNFMCRCPLDQACGCRRHRAELPEGHALHGGIDGILARCLAKDPDERPDTAMEVYEALCCLPVAPWNSTTALEWWSLHLPELVRTDPTPPLSGPTWMGPRRRGRRC